MIIMESSTGKGTYNGERWLKLHCKEQMTFLMWGMKQIILSVIDNPSSKLISTIAELFWTKSNILYQLESVWIFIVTQFKKSSLLENKITINQGYFITVYKAIWSCIQKIYIVHQENSCFLRITDTVHPLNMHTEFCQGKYWDIGHKTKFLHPFGFRVMVFF